MMSKVISLLYNLYVESELNNAVKKNSKSKPVKLKGILKSTDLSDVQIKEKK